MVGEHTVRIYADEAIVKITFKRKYTVIRDKTGSGKTYIRDLLKDMTDGSERTAKLVSDIPFYRIKDMYGLENVCKNYEPGVCYVDENKFIKSEEFAKLSMESPHYFVVIYRHPLEMIPYSVQEIYYLYTYRSKGKNVLSIKPVYSFNDRLSFEPEYIITEDSNSGYQFFKYVFKNAEVISAGGKSNIKVVLTELLAQHKSNILIVADGAAFGSNIEFLCDELTRHNFDGSAKICVYLPESFEWLVLRSAIFRKFKIDNRLEHTENYADIEKYISWERYYTALLTYLSKNYKVNYKKSKLSKFFLKQTDKIMDVIRRDI